MKNKKYRVDRLLRLNLSEGDVDPIYDDDDDDDGDENKSKLEKEKEVDKKDIKDVDKDDLEDEEESSVDNNEVAVSVVMNTDGQGGGKIKLIPYDRLTSMVSIESLISLFDIDPENVNGKFKDKIELTIKSPVTDFSDEKYIVRLMDAIGEITIQKKDFNKTITKKSTGINTSLQQAVDQQISVPGEEKPEEKPEESIDLSYLPELNYEFKKSVKDEFFNRIISSKNG